jgi:hypothetical protein
MFILMLETVVRRGDKGFFVGNHNEVVEVDDALGAALIQEGKAALATFDQGTGQDLEPITADMLATVVDEAGNPIDVPGGDLQADLANPAEIAPVPQAAAPKPVKNKGGRPKRAAAPAAAAPADTDPAPVAGDEAPAA